MLNPPRAHSTMWGTGRGREIESRRVSMLKLKMLAGSEMAEWGVTGVGLNNVGISDWNGKLFWSWMINNK